MAEKSLLDEISTAIAQDDEGQLVEETPEVQDEPESPSEGGQTDAEVNAEDEAPADAEDTEESSASDAEEPAEEPTEEEGEDASEEGEEDAPKEGTDVPEKGKTEDPVNDPIPDTVTDRTKQRIETLIGRVKEAESYKASYDELVGTLSSTGASPEEFGQMVQYMRLVHSDKPEDQRVALQALQAEMRALAMKLGEPVSGVDFLADYPDLQTAVEAQEITAEHAQEIAAARAQRAAATQQSQTQAQQQQARQEFQTAVQQAQNGLNALEQKLQSDPDYRAKYDILVPALRETFRELHPSLWVSTFERAYSNLKLPAAPAPAPRPKPAQQPLRPKQPAGQGAKQPSSVLDAVNSALESM